MIKIWEINLESTENYKKRLQDQNKKISGLVLKVSIAIKITENYQEAVNKNKTQQEKRIWILEEDIVKAIAVRKAAETIL
jgi:translation initiation factor IF-1